LSKEAFTWGPRPLPAQELLNAWKKNSDGKSREDFELSLHNWYAKDKMKTIQAEFVEIFKVSA
jgi:hypothetical protein